MNQIFLKWWLLENIKKNNKEKVETPKGEEDDQQNWMEAEKNDEKIVKCLTKEKFKTLGFKDVYFKLESFYSPHE